MNKELIEKLQRQINDHKARGVPTGPMEINPNELQVLLDSCSDLLKK